MSETTFDRQSAISGLIRIPATMYFVVVLALVPWLSEALPKSWVDFPADSVIPLAPWIGDKLTWLAREATIGSVRISDITRGLASILDAPMNVLGIVLANGVQRGTGEHVHTAVPSLSWLAVVGASGIFAHLLGGRRLAITVVVGLLYIVIFGLWTDAMVTVASVAMSTTTAVAVGVAIGSIVCQRPWATSIVVALMNVMQTVPVFSYLVPTLLFLGYGPSAAMVSTVIYALPPMVHATILGLKSVPSEVIEYGTMAGATPHQMYWKFRMPSAMPMLGVGLNQAIMACLNMVIIASMIGSGGLGYLVLTALRRLDIGAALEGGLAIVVLAVVMDRLGQAAAQRLASGRAISHKQFPYLRMAIAWIVVATTLALIFPLFQKWPDTYVITTAPMWNALITWINIHCFDVLDAIRSFTLINLMNPTKNFMLSVPWSVAMALLAVGGFLLGGMRIAVIVTALAAFVLLTGFWRPAIVSIYLITLGSLLSLTIGLPIGFAIAQKPSWRAATDLALDTLQTMPTLVYILPAVMLFRNGDFSAVLAIFSYAVAPAVRYAIHGFSSVPSTRVEAIRMCGGSRWQTFKWVQFPSAFPTLLLGVNQTVMMAIAMLVITALVGTRDLGQQVFIALSQMKVGNGVVGGLAVAAIALTVDTLLRAAAKRAAERNNLKL